jgi:hypothetical protein
MALGFPDIHLIISSATSTPLHTLHRRYRHEVPPKPTILHAHLQPLCSRVLSIACDVFCMMLATPLVGVGGLAYSQVVLAYRHKVPQSESTVWKS